MFSDRRRTFRLTPNLNFCADIPCDFLPLPILTKIYFCFVFYSVDGSVTAQLINQYFIKYLISRED
jgi:hypothetical protein